MIKKEVIKKLEKENNKYFNYFSSLTIVKLSFNN